MATLISSGQARTVLSTISVLTGLVILFTILQSTPSYIKPRMEKCLEPVLDTQHNHLNLPGLSRLVCILAPYFVDCSRTDYGRLVVQLLMAYVAPITLLEMVEASRVGNQWTMLACMPFAALFSYSTGIGIYLPLFFVPLMISGRSRVESTAVGSSLSLPRVYALLTAHVLNLLSLVLIFFPGPEIVGEGKSWIPTGTALNVVLQLSLWFIYTPLTWVFKTFVVPEPATEQGQAQQLRTARCLIRDAFLIMAGMNASFHLVSALAFWHGSTPLEHLTKSFHHPFRVEHFYYAPAYFLLWDFFGAVCGAFFWIVSDSQGLYEPVLFLGLSALLSPGSALMLYSAHREQRLLNQFDSRTKLKSM